MRIRRKGTYDKQIKEMQKSLEQLYRQLDRDPSDDTIMKIRSLHLTLEQFGE